MRSRLRLVARVARVERDDAGFTLVELLIGMVVTSFILSAISMSLYLALHNIDATADSLVTSRYAQTLGVWLPADVETVGVTGIDTRTGTLTGCSGASPGTNLVRFVSSDASAIVDYRVVPADTAWQLVRFSCATGQAATQHVVADGMPSAASATVTIASAGNPAVTSVTIAAVARSGRSDPYAFSITGSARTPAAGACAVVSAPSNAVVVNGSGHLDAPVNVVVLTAGACSGLSLRFSPAGSSTSVALTGGPTTWTASLGTATTWTAGTKTVTVVGSSAPATFSIAARYATTVVVTSSANPAALGDPLVVTTTVTGPSGTPSGIVVLHDGDVVLARLTLAAGRASFTTSALTVATHPLVATYQGDATYADAVSGALAQVVKQRPRLALTSSINPSTFGQTVKLTLTVAGDVGVPTGTATFTDVFNGISTTIGTGTLDASGATSIAVSNLAIGTHTLSARYAGDLSYLPATSATLAQTVTRRPSVTVVVASANPAAVGQPVTFHITVTGAGPAPAGTITLWDGAVSPRQGTLDAVGHLDLIMPLTLGTHPITAKYLGDANYLPSESTVLDVVAKIQPVVALTATPNPSVAGDSVHIVAVVSPQAPVPTGAVSFFDNGNLLQSPTVDGAGAAAIDVADLAPGRHSITAVYSGDASFLGATSPVVTQMVNDAPCRVVTRGSTTPSPIPRGNGDTTGPVTFSIETTPGCGAVTIGFSNSGFSAAPVATGPTTWTWVAPNDTPLSGGDLTIEVRNDGVLLDSWTSAVG